MADNAIAVVVAGTGETTPDEVNDLLSDFFSPDAEIGLIVPIDKDLFSKSVVNAIDWYLSDPEVTEQDVYTVQTKGAKLTRASAAIGQVPDMVEEFADVLRGATEGFDEKVFIVALPDPEDDDFNFYVSLVEVALEHEWPVKNLSAGLDDVVIEDEAEEEPAPEAEKPAPRARKRRGVPRDTAEPEEVTPEPEVAPEKPARKAREKKPEPAKEVDNSDAMDVVLEAVVWFEKFDETNALINRAPVVYRPLSVALRSAYEALVGSPVVQVPTEEPEAPEKPARASRKGVGGRPRSNFEVKQILNDDGEWVPRPRGRMSKGTQYRTLNTETDTVTDQGEA